MAWTKQLNETKTISCITVVITKTESGQACTLRIDSNFGQEEIEVPNFTICGSTTTMINDCLTAAGYSEAV
ncbi:MAG: hypothetical protein RLY43_1874 [Bacteroidota bacterium]|jgi:hypothetical protein